MKLLNYKVLLLILFINAGSASLFARIKMPAIFGDDMVLQQKTNVSVWGWSNPSATVKIVTSWNKKIYSCKAGANGEWKTKVSTPAAGGPYEITISDGETVKIKNILIGEVWLCSGQSNMEMPVKGYRSQPVLGSNEVIVASKNNRIRLFNVKKVTSTTPQKNFSGNWNECNPETVADFSASAYFFGKMLNQVLDVPVGLICSCWGGTPIEAWTSELGLKPFSEIKIPAKEDSAKINSQSATVLFNAMIAPLVGYGIRGSIWYQGETNRNNPDLYEKEMPALVGDWRSKWGIGDFAFYYAQIAPHDYGKSGLNSAYLREAQLNALKEIPNSGMATLMDIGEKKCIHPSHKEITGDRLAYLALAQTYNIKGIGYSGPTFKSMTTTGGKIKIEFDHAANGLTAYGKELSCFEVAGNDKTFYPAKASISGSSVILTSEEVKDPVSVRYAFKDFIVGDLYNTEGLPASSFRTDNWDK